MCSDHKERVTVIRRTGSLLLIAVLAAVGLFVAGCGGGGSHPSVASLGSSTTTGSTTPGRLVGDGREQPLDRERARSRAAGADSSASRAAVLT